MKTKKKHSKKKKAGPSCPFDPGKGTTAVIRDVVKSFEKPKKVQTPTTKSRIITKLLGEKIDEHDVHVYLVNTGWTGGPYGVGKLMSIKDTRACINGILNGSINDAEFETLPIFNLSIPKHLDGVADDAVLNHRNTWEDKASYDASLAKLAEMFVANFERYNDRGDEFDFSSAGPQLS